MKISLSALAIGLLCLAGWTVAGEQKKKLEDPTPRKDAILKLFVEEFVPITPGKEQFPESFMMGSEKGGQDNERPVHKVTFKYPFAMAKYEVTQELYHVVMGKNPRRVSGPAQRHGPRQLERSQRILREGDQAAARTPS